MKKLPAIIFMAEVPNFIKLPEAAGSYEIRLNEPLQSLIASYRLCFVLFLSFKRLVARKIMKAKIH